MPDDAWVAAQMMDALVTNCRILIIDPGMVESELLSCVLLTIAPVASQTWLGFLANWLFLATLVSARNGQAFHHYYLMPTVVHSLTSKNMAYPKCMSIRYFLPLSQ